MRYAWVLWIALVACNRETEIAKVEPPAGWSEVTAGNAAAIGDLALDYRERRTLAIRTYESPAGERLRVITLQSGFAPQSLIGRLTKYRRANPTQALGDLVIDSLDADDERHVGVQIARPPSNDPDRVVRSPTLVVSCLAPRVDATGPCMRAIDASVAAMKDAAGGSWMYWYIAGIAFAALVFGRYLQIPWRLMPSKSPTRLPQATLRK